MNPVQKYSHITEQFACTQKMFDFMFLFPIKSLISSVTYSHQNYRNKHFPFCYKIKQSNMFQRLHIHQGLLHKPHFLFFQAGYLLNTHHYILVHFDNTPVFQSLLKDEKVLKILFFSIKSS